jgi:outer membrane protein assembly factor BamD
VRKFPDSRYAEDSEQRMRYLTNALGLFDVHVAEYYYTRGAYVASANRAQATLLNFPNTPANERALDILAKSYDKLGLPQLAEDSRQILARTFPKSVYVAGNAPRAKPWWKFW